jgi:TolB-like protein
LGKLYGQEWNLIKLGRMPALFIIDQKGSIAFAQYAKNMADIPENSELLHILEGLN